ncbi:hypothetical protein [Conservatibacter flavescens]|uniref:Uncharacterized protein n=1 Tax=Conservatibacter flavescens TaxID=28161 RepID=A0A2M8S1U4_9PAST|nr:hypothetical protein [Conservatibacter flavescens]PJG85066.1 hypothetical protein CVP05_07355 [Conservatibacter flavescens]
MKNQLTEEKELLIMKGDALRMKLLAQSQHTRRNVSQPFAGIKNLGLSFSNPLIRALLFALLKRKLLTVKGLSYSALGLTALYLLGNRQK